jgi:hypothetical protein
MHLLMAIVAQGLEHLVVVQDVAGSIPVNRPTLALYVKGDRLDPQGRE